MKKLVKCLERFSKQELYEQLVAQIEINASLVRRWEEETESMHLIHRVCGGMSSYMSNDKKIIRIKQIIGQRMSPEQVRYRERSIAFWKGVLKDD